MTEDWADLAPPPKSYSEPDKPPLRFGLSKGTGTRFRGRILFTRKLLDELCPGCLRLKVRLGTGPNTHQICIIPDERGNFSLTRTGKGAAQKPSETFRLMLPIIEKWPKQTIETVEVKYQIQPVAGRKALFVDLPPAIWKPSSQTRMRT